MDETAGIPNPYVGPKPFETGQKLFGRDREVAEIGYLLTSERIVLLYAPSGAGKSSLVQAGLLPRLQKKFDCWGITRVGQEPPPGTKNRYVWSTLSGLEKTGPVPPDMTLAQYFAQRKKTRNPLIVFDQFEEILRVDPVDIDAKKEYFTQLCELLSDPSVWALFVLREDYLAPLDPYRNMLPTHLQNGYRLDRLTRPAAIDAVVKPVESTPRRYAPGVAEKLVENLAGMKVQQLDGSFREESGIYVEPLQLQVVCFDLWERMPKDDLVIDQDQVGDIGNALSNYYARAVAAVAKGSEAVERRIREWFQTRLITSDGIRNQVRQETGQSGGLDNALIEKLVETYVVRSEPRAGATWFELAHDRLIRPVQEDNAKWFEDHLSELQKKATLWEEQGRPDGLLWLDARKVKAAGKTQEEPEKSFLEASRLMQRELRRKRQGVWALGIISLAAVVAAITATIETGRAHIALANSQVENVEESLKSPMGPGVAMSYLSSAMSYDPTSLGARAWISDLLARRSWWLPSMRVQQAKLATCDISPDGKLAVTISEDGEIQLWDTATGQKHGEPMKMDGPGKDVEFSHDGRLLFSTSHSETRLWDVATQKQVGKTMKYDKPADYVRFSPNDEFLLTSSWEAQEASVWSTASGVAICTDKQDGHVIDADVNALGDRLITASNDSNKLGHINLWSIGPDGCEPLRSGSNRQSDPPSIRRVDTVRFSRDGAYIVTSTYSSDNTDRYGGIDIWDAGLDLNTPLVSRPMNSVEAAVFSPTDRTIAITAHGEARLWQFDDKTSEPVTLKNANAIWIATFTDDGERLVTASEGGVQEWDVKSGAAIGSPMAVPGHLSGFQLSRDGTTIVTSSRDSSFATVWRMESSQSGHGEQVAIDTNEQLLFMANTLSGVRFLVAVTDAQGHTSVCVRDDADRPLLACIPVATQLDDSDFFLSTDSRYLFQISIKADSAAIWDARTGQLIRRWDPKNLREFSNHSEIEFSPDSKRIVLCEGESTQVYESATGKPLGTLKSGSDPDFSPDGSLLLTPDADGARLWAADTGEVKQTRLDPNVAMSGFLADGTPIMISTDSVSTKTLNVATGKPFGPPLGLTSSTSRNFKISPSNKYLLAEDKNLTVQVWDMTTGKRIGMPVYNSEPTLDWTFSPDGLSFITATRTKAQMWDAGTGKPIGEEMAVNAQNIGVVRSAGGRQIYIGDYDNARVTRFRIFLGTGSAADNQLLGRLAELVGGYRWDAATNAPVVIAPEERFKRMNDLREQYKVPEDKGFLQDFIQYLSRPLPSQPQK